MKIKKTICLLTAVMGTALCVSACGTPKEEAAAASSASSQSSEAQAADASGSAEGALPVEVLDPNGPMVVINTEGAGQVARAADGDVLAFNEEYNVTQTMDRVKEGTVLTIGAKAGEGWKFVKWTVNGKDYSSDEQTTITADEEMQIVAVFEAE